MKVKRSKFERVLYPIVYVILMIFAVFILYFFYFALQLATKADSREFTYDFATNNLSSWSKNFTLSHFAEAFTELEVKNNSYFEMVINSLIYSFGSTTLSLFFSSCTTYVVAKYRFPGRKFLFNMVIAMMIIPIYGALPANFRAYKLIGIYDNWLILVSACTGFSSFLILYSFWKGIEWDYAEAAFMDGAKHFQVFIQIMLPMMFPTLSVLFVTSLIGGWNEYMSVSLFLPSHPTLAYGLYVYEEIMTYRANQPVYFAGVVLAAIPCFVLFALTSNSIMQRLHLGGLKG